MWPLNIRLGAPPEPSSRPTTFGRPSSTSCQLTARPIDSSTSRMQSAIGCSLPVGLEMSTNALAVATRRSSSTASISR